MAKLTWNPPAWQEIIRWPLPHGGPIDRMLLRMVTLLGRSQVAVIRGIENLRPELDPFILVANHSSRREALMLPALLTLHRGGRLIHFIADWNFGLIPGVGFLYRRGGVIRVTRKPVKPRFLNALKPFYVDPVPALERARRHLLAGRPVGIFPEGAVNRDPARLLGGRNGAARLSLETGAPLVPVGICFPNRSGDRIGPMEIEIGAPMAPPEAPAGAAPLALVRHWHATAMIEIARLSGKQWSPRKGGCP